MLDIQHISKKYKGQRDFALQQCNLTIEDHEVFGLLGPNGAGKTTLFSIVCGITNPSEGTIYFNGDNLLVNQNKYKYKIGVVPQDIALYPTLTGFQNLLFIGRMYNLKKPQLSKKIHQLLDTFGFEDNRFKNVSTYSGGMRRKINLIGGLLHDPDLLLLDEPTAGMDVQSRNALMALLKKMNKEQQVSILYTSHYLEQAEQFCDRIAILDQGVIKAKGVPREVIQQNEQSTLEATFLSLTNQEQESVS